MKKFFLLALLAILTSCFTDVDPGYVSVRVHKRGSRAGETEILTTGRHSWKAWVTEFEFPTFKQNYVWTADRAEGSPNDESLTFPIEGLKINVDLGIEFAVNPEGVGKILAEYRKKLDEITDGPMRSYVRDSLLEKASGYLSMEEFISKNQISEMVNLIEEDVQGYFAERGINVSKVYLVNAPRYPPTVVASIEAKIKATQDALRIQNEVESKRAEAEKRKIDADVAAYEVLANAEAEAEAARLKRANYTEQLLRAMWIEKWNGELPETMAGSDAGILLGK